MSISGHGRSDSSDTTSSRGSSYQLILDHILTYPGSYEIPLRTMYALNCAPRGHQHHQRNQTPSSSGSSPLTPQGIFQDDRATQTFTESLMAEISHLPNQPACLPPSFITSFLQRCFPSRLVDIDFPQALTGLDYLKDLETRRRREVAAAFERLDIDRETLNSEEDQLSSRYPGIAKWVQSIEEKERKIDALYTQLYIGLRRWILINELSLTPFNKHNCVAMLNTLYPPVISSQPTTKLTREILKNQRDGFFKYIQSVEKNGSQVLRNLMQQGKAPADANGWGAVTRTLGLYLQLANSMISECSEITDVQHVSPRQSSGSKPSKQPRKADSEPNSPTEPPRPKTPSGGKHSTALEKLARGLKTIGRNRTDATEMIPDNTPPQPPSPKAKGLRKMRSMGALEGRKASKIDVSAASFDSEEMRRHRLKYEAGAHAARKLGKSTSHEI
ncbi:hypothetical protein LTR37_014694 [Vermiconidia calcicola]|uniref:Uncharacterized protein n=1 Tax=Vermiconidia calcicola TaxID=1690605 RepID=A0ACC3MSZ1_9PEZI|nr:hypothetical protein LTR37_014694 [Vermiconidia calcicola]